MDPGSISYVLVTGATGFVGAHIVDELLRRGLKVRLAARSKAKAEQMLQDRAQYADRLDFVQIGDLTQPGVFNEAVKGVDAIVHTASPVTLEVKDNEKDLIIPAITGTTSALQAAKTEPKIKRFVYTSSFAAIFDANKGAGPGVSYTNADWNPITYDEAKTSGPLPGYRASKKFAEKAAWDFMQNEHPHFDLVSLCPPFVYGPIAYPISSLSELKPSNMAIWVVANGANPIPPTFNPRFVDVRDLAFAHVEALLRPEVSNQRFIVASPETYTYQREADILREEFDWAREEVTKGDEGAPIPDSCEVDGETASKALGFQYRSFKECVLDSIKQFKEIQRAEGSA